ncbi:hypothetical protein [Roseomonas sp. HF4]|uniref:hypothetical protein n=1 Tax=Roseomonas sp. HF4 TaxID=2562313 RepID=UPI0014851C79|nr:hypothetical protein [Roseomonas sp. HF4]
MLLYFALGCAVGARGRIAAPAGLGNRQVAGIVLVAMAVCGTTMAALVAIAGPETFAAMRAGGIAALAWHPLSAVAAIAGTVAVAAASARLSGSLRAAFAFLGRRSMAIYVLHVMALAGTRIVMTKLFGIATPALLPLLVFVGVTVPLAASGIARRLGLARALGL